MVFSLYLGKTVGMSGSDPTLILDFIDLAIQIDFEN